MEKDTILIKAIYCYLTTSVDSIAEIVHYAVPNVVKALKSMDGIDVSISINGKPKKSPVYFYNKKQLDEQNIILIFYLVTNNFITQKNLEKILNVSQGTISKSINHLRDKYEELSVTFDCVNI